MSSCEAKTQKGTKCTRKCTKGKYCKTHQKKVGGKSKYFGKCPHCEEKINNWKKDLLIETQEETSFSSRWVKHAVYRCARCENIISISSAPMM